MKTVNRDDAFVEPVGIPGFCCWSCLKVSKGV